jgi:hypothetical protein
MSDILKKAFKLGFQKEADNNTDGIGTAAGAVAGGGAGALFGNAQQDARVNSVWDDINSQIDDARMRNEVRRNAVMGPLKADRIQKEIQMQNLSDPSKIKQLRSERDVLGQTIGQVDEQFENRLNSRVNSLHDDAASRVSKLLSRPKRMAAWALPAAILGGAGGYLANQSISE